MYYVVYFDGMSAFMECNENDLITKYKYIKRFSFHEDLLASFNLCATEESEKRKRNGANSHLKSKLCCVMDSLMDSIKLLTQ